ncbi:MAG TPA: ABC transporter permease [Rhodocyclaceae bacterium]|nr:ABC transporter permease [Rhodocyclaceae bacterium]
MLNITRILSSEWCRWARLGWLDIQSRYRRTTFGPMWIVLLTGMTVGSIGFVYGSLFKAPIKDFLPFLAIGFVTWGWISSSLVEAGECFSAYKSMMLNHVLSPSSVLVRVVFRNWLVLLHNALVIVALLFILQRPLSLVTLLVVPGMLVVGGVIFSTSIIVAFACARFRDLKQVLASALSLGLLITPVIWSPEILKDRIYVAYLNPFSHLLDLIRLPLLAVTPSATNWAVAFGTLLICSMVARIVITRYRHLVIFWL